MPVTKVSFSCICGCVFFGGFFGGMAGTEHGGRLNCWGKILLQRGANSRNELTREEN
jgi:hypothetical protein